MESNWLLKPTDSILTKDGKSYIYIKNTVTSDTKVEKKNLKFQYQHN